MSERKPYRTKAVMQRRGMELKARMESGELNFIYIGLYDVAVTEENDVVNFNHQKPILCTSYENSNQITMHHIDISNDLRVSASIDCLKRQYDKEMEELEASQEIDPLS